MRYYVEQLVTSGARHNAVMLAVSLQMYDRAADILLSSKLVTVSMTANLRPVFWSPDLWSANHVLLHEKWTVKPKSMKTRYSRRPQYRPSVDRLPQVPNIFFIGYIMTPFTPVCQYCRFFASPESGGIGGVRLYYYKSWAAHFQV